MGSLFWAVLCVGFLALGVGAFHTFATNDLDACPDPDHYSIHQVMLLILSFVGFTGGVYILLAHT